MSLAPDDKQFILRLAKANPAQFCYHLFHVAKHPTEANILRKEGSFVFTSEKNRVTTYGHLATVQQLLRKFSFENGGLYEIYFPSHHLPVVEARFDNLELIDETGKGNYNTFLCLSLEKTQFIPKRQTKNGKKIDPELLADFDGKFKRYAEEGLVYGIVEEKIVSLAPIPYILDVPLSYGILQDIWTEESHRKQGYATGTVRSILNFLFTRRGSKAAYCWVEEQNPAKHMLERIGFQNTGLLWNAARGIAKDLR